MNKMYAGLWISVSFLVILSFFGCKNGVVNVTVPEDAYNDAKDIISNAGFTEWINEKKVLTNNQIVDHAPLSFRGVKNNVNVKYTIKSTEVIDVYFMASKEDVEFFKQHQTYIHYPSCSSTSITNKEGTCTDIPSNFTLMIVNGDKNNDVELNVKYQIIYSPSPTN